MRTINISISEGLGSMKENKAMSFKELSKYIDFKKLKFYITNMTMEMAGQEIIKEINIVAYDR